MGLSLKNRRPLSVSQGRPSVGDQQQSYAGGLNTVSAPDALQPNQFRRGDDGRLTPFGAFIKRGGNQRVANPAFASTSVVNGATWYRSDGSAQIFTIYSNGGAAGTTYGAFPLTWTLGPPGEFSTMVIPSFAAFIKGSSQESFYIADGNGLHRYDGTFIHDIAAAPDCDSITVHNERLWGCGDPAFPDSIFYSDLNDGDSLGIGASGGGQIIVRTYGNQNCVGVVSLGTSLMIFHPTGISRLTGYGQSDVTVSPAGITGDVGTSAPQSIVRAENTVYFVSDRGLYAATEQQVVPVATPEQPDPLTLILPSMASANIAQIRSTYNHATREVYIEIPGFGIFIYQTVLRAWAGPWGSGLLSPETTTLFETHNSDGYPIILRGDASGYISELDRPGVLLDNVNPDGTGGTTYAMALQMRRFYCGDPNTAKAWRFVYVLADLNGSNATNVQWNTGTTTDSLNLPVSTSATWGGAGTTWGTGTWGSVSQLSYRLPMDGNGYYVDVLITDSGQAQPTFSQCGVQGYALGRR